MKRLKFKCILKSDIVLSQSSATKNSNKSLDFIPGNNFLGIVARSLYTNTNDKTFTIFHSGKVKFGDANLSIGNSRGVKVPLAMFKPKQIKTELYIHHHIPNLIELRGKQLKQQREGYYVFDADSKVGTCIKVGKNFKIKSSYDVEHHRSQDNGMYGYESLPKGSTLMFDVEIDDTAACYESEIKNALVGIRHLGRSKSAEYGLIEIEECNTYTEVESYSKGFSIGNDKCISVYADSRLIFLDKNGYPRFTLEPADLGIKEDGAEIDWSKSQIRTFQYSPWNYKRQAFDADRCGIEKGSVIVVKCSTAPCLNAYVGDYCNEGFGKIIYNPYFLAAYEDGKAVYTLKDSEKENYELPKGASDLATPLLQFLNSKKTENDEILNCFDKVNKFVDENKSRFKKELFASQWGSIRSLAMVTSDANNLIESVDAYLNHGMASEKWKLNQRKFKLDNFMNDNKGNNLQNLIINLCSQMAKEFKKES